MQNIQIFYLPHKVFRFFYIKFAWLIFLSREKYENTGSSLKLFYFF